MTGEFIKRVSRMNLTRKVGNNAGPWWTGPAKALNPMEHLERPEHGWPPTFNILTELERN